MKRMKTHVLLTTGRFVGIRVMVPEFSTLAAIRDGDYCRPWVDLNESLWHNNGRAARSWGAQPGRKTDPGIEFSASNVEQLRYFGESAWRRSRAALKNLKT